MNKRFFCLLLSLPFLLTACTSVVPSETKLPETDPPQSVETDAADTFSPIGETETDPPQKVEYDDSYTTEVTEIRTKVKERENRPTEFERGSSYDDLIFYDSGNENSVAPPVSAVIISPEEVLARFNPYEGGYGFWDTARLSDSSLTFDEIARITVSNTPQNSYNFQMGFGHKFFEGKTESGNTILIHFFARVLENTGRLGVVIEQSGENGSYDKLLSEELTLTSKWKEFYIPVSYDIKYTSFNLRFGYMTQTIEIGGFEILDYGKDVYTYDLPSTVTSTNESLQKDAAWREEALKRIDEVRKGDINVAVVNASGAPIAGVKVEIEMYEHEFEWGAGVNQNLLSNKQMQDAVSRYFNSAVLENELKWTMYEANKDRPKKIISLLSDLGIDTVRGHCLVWDRNRRQNDTSVPTDLPALYGDRAAMTERIRSHIEEVMTDMDGLLVDWDVLNEACNNTTMQDIYGRELIKEWFDMALDYGGDTNLYYNDFMMGGQLFDLLDEMERLGVVYDGIGVQSHYSSAKNMNDIYDFYNKLTKYGKDLKVTEYDFATSDERLRAEFTRDLMILTFSVEEFKGFYLWGIKGGKYVCFDNNWNPRPALEQMEDLIYNKWMTKDSGRTGADGVAEFDGFYGSYKISVIADGVKKTVYVDCHKDGDNVIRIEMPD